MRILLDLLHPAHVHFFAEFRTEMLAAGHEVLVTSRKKDLTVDLLERLEIPHTVLSTQRSGKALGLELAARTRKLDQVVRDFRPDVLAGIMGPSIAICGAIRRIPTVVFYDTEFSWQTNWFAYRLATMVCTPDCYQGHVPGENLRYAGYHELARLHPKRFTPDSSRLARFGLSVDERYSVVRFVSWQSVHDTRERALSNADKRALVRRLERFGKVVVSVEGTVPPGLERYGLVGPPEDVHHVLAFASICVGESATMSAEAAVLGTPAVYIADTGRGYTQDLEARYGLVRRFDIDGVSDAVHAIDDCLETDPAFFEEARQRMLGDKIDVTEWMVDLFESRFP